MRTEFPNVADVFRGFLATDHRHESLAANYGNSAYVQHRSRLLNLLY